MSKNASRPVSFTGARIKSQLRRSEWQAPRDKLTPQANVGRIGCRSVGSRALSNSLALIVITLNQIPRRFEEIAEQAGLRFPPDHVGQGETVAAVATGGQRDPAGDRNPRVWSKYNAASFSLKEGL